MGSSAESNRRISFRPIGRSDFPLLQKWLAAPHVAVWWNEPFDLSSLEAKYGPRMPPGSSLRFPARQIVTDPLNHRTSLRRSRESHRARLQRDLPLGGTYNLVEVPAVGAHQDIVLASGEYASGRKSSDLAKSRRRTKCTSRWCRQTEDAATHSRAECRPFVSRNQVLNRDQPTHKGIPAPGTLAVDGIFSV